MDFRQLKYFTVAIELGSLKKAAEQLHISQPAISKSIKDLEDELGSPLLNRGARGVAANALGQSLYNRAKAALADIEQARQEIMERAIAGSGPLTIATTGIPAARLLPQAILEFRKRHPVAALHISEQPVDTVITLVQRGEAVLGICPVGPAFQREGVLQLPLFEVEPVILCRTDHPLGSAPPARLADLEPYVWITSSADARPSLNLNLAFEAENLPPPGRVIRSDSQLLTRSLLLDSDCLTMSPIQLFQREYDRGLLHQLNIKLQWPKSIQYGIVLRQHGYQTQEVREFRDIVERLVRESPDFKPIA